MINFRNAGVLAVLLFSISIVADNLAQMPPDISEEIAKDPSMFSDMLGMFKDAPAQEGKPKQAIEEMELVRTIFKGASSTSKAKKALKVHSNLLRVKVVSV